MIRQAQRGAFTLVEVLMSAALLTGLLVTGVALAFQFSTVLQSQADDPVFDRHADGLELFLRAYRVPDAMGAAQVVPAEEAGVLPALRLAVPVDAPLLTGKARAKTDGAMALAFRQGSGLWLIWQTRAGAGSDEKERVLLSPWVTEAQVLRYDTKSDRWDAESEKSPALADWRVLRIDLAHAGRQRTVWIPWETRPEQGGRNR